MARNTDSTGDKHAMRQANRSDIFHCTNSLRWVIDSIYERYLQQAWVSETGEVDWQDVPTVSLSPDSDKKERSP